MGKWDGLPLVNGLGVFPVAVLPNPKIGIFGGLGLHPQEKNFTYPQTSYNVHIS